MCCCCVEKMIGFYVLSTTLEDTKMQVRGWEHEGWSVAKGAGLEMSVCVLLASDSLGRLKQQRHDVAPLRLLCMHPLPPSLSPLTPTGRRAA